LEREYNLDLITTAPSVIYKVNLTNGETVFIDNPTNYPDVANIASAEEPIVNAHICHIRIICRIINEHNCAVGYLQGKSD
jgi:translation elongation factor EF-4